MRRLFIAAAAGAVLAAAGCSTAPDANATPGVTLPAGATSPAAAGTGAATGPTPPSPKPALTGKAGDTALAGNTLAICNQVQKMTGQFASMWGQDRKLLEDAKNAKDQPDLVSKVQEKSTRDVDNYAFALTDMSKLVADAKVKQALADTSKQVTALRGDVQKIDQGKLDGWSAGLRKACVT
jgi:hypothetical protein